jgi:hypothetical protein
MMHHTQQHGSGGCKVNRLEDTLIRIAESGHSAIEDRLRSLDGEWSIGRMVKATAGVLILGGLALTLLVNPWFGLIPAFGGLVLAQYLVMRHSWLGDMFSTFGFRSSIDIDHERIALKALRGDFRHLPTIHEIEDRDAISRFEDEGGPAFEPESPRVAPQEAAHEVIVATRL